MRLILVLFVVATCSFYELLASPIYEDAEFLRQKRLRIGSDVKQECNGLAADCKIIEIGSIEDGKVHDMTNSEQENLNKEVEEETSDTDSRRSKRQVPGKILGGKVLQMNDKIVVVQGRGKRQVPGKILGGKVLQMNDKIVVVQGRGKRQVPGKILGGKVLQMNDKIVVVQGSGK
uniref:Uncharacterized protein n=1 Tax=Acrobeloides nanus TaxID=290746 RepID=A0A914EIX8_9BILA